MIFRLVSAKSKIWAEIWVKPFFLQKFDLSVPARHFIIFEIFISLYLLKKNCSQAVLADLNQILQTIFTIFSFLSFFRAAKELKKTTKATTKPKAAAAAPKAKAAAKAQKASKPMQKAAPRVGGKR